METAVRDLAETENDLQTELQHMLRRSKQVGAPGSKQMRERMRESGRRSETRCFGAWVLLPELSLVRC